MNDNELTLMADTEALCLNLVTEGDLDGEAGPGVPVLRSVDMEREVDTASEAKCLTTKEELVVGNQSTRLEEVQLGLGLRHDGDLSDLGEELSDPDCPHSRLLSSIASQQLCPLRTNFHAKCKHNAKSIPGSEDTQYDLKVDRREPVVLPGTSESPNCSPIYKKKV
jgi:hypothetical protein